MSLSALNTRYARGNRRRPKSFNDDRERCVTIYICSNKAPSSRTHLHVNLSVQGDTETEEAERAAQQKETDGNVAVRIESATPLSVRMASVIVCSWLLLLLRSKREKTCNVPRIRLAHTLT